MTDLTKIPGIGVKLAQYLTDAGYPTIESLKGQDPNEIFTKRGLIEGAGNQPCKCELYCYRLAVAYADNDGVLPRDKQNWGDWKD